MEHTYREQVLAFAGVWQAAKLVQDIARTGTLDNDDFEACIKTLFVTDPDTTEEVYVANASGT